MANCPGPLDRSVKTDDQKTDGYLHITDDDVPAASRKKMALSPAKDRQLVAVVRQAAWRGDAV